MRGTLLSSLLFMSLAISTAHAFESLKELPNTGLTLAKHDGVELRAEEISISAEEIRVGYRFFNASGTDATTSVTYSPPALESVYFSEVNVGVPVDFKYTVNGKPITPLITERAFAKGVDRTELLRSLNVPSDSRKQETRDALDRVPHDQWALLLDSGLAIVEEYQDGAKHLAPRWAIHATHHWEQVFPARTETVIEHRYRPSVGVLDGTGLGEEAAAKQAWYSEYQKKYCLEPQLLSTVTRARKEVKNKGESYIPYDEARIDFMLKTGARWAAPINDFRLVINKGAADNLVSFCGHGVKKISATEFEMRKTDFIPREDLHVLILEKTDE